MLHVCKSNYQILLMFCKIRVKQDFRKLTSVISNIASCKAGLGLVKVTETKTIPVLVVLFMSNTSSRDPLSGKSVCKYDTVPG